MRDLGNDFPDRLRERRPSGEAARHFGISDILAEALVGNGAGSSLGQRAATRVGIAGFRSVDAGSYVVLPGCVCSCADSSCQGPGIHRPGLSRKNFRQAVRTGIGCRFGETAPDQASMAGRRHACPAQRRNCQSVSVSSSRQAGRRAIGSCRVRTALRPPVDRKLSQSIVTMPSPM